MKKKTKFGKISALMLSGAMLCAAGGLALSSGNAGSLSVRAFAVQNETEGFFEYSESAAGITIERYTGNETDITVPAEINGIPVTEIGSNAFNGCASVRIISLPESITSVGESAFEKCTSLENIEIPGGVKVLPERVFLGSGLKSVMLNEGLEEIDGYAFGLCKNLQSVTIPSTVKNIGSYAFYSIYNIAGDPLKELIVLGSDTVFEDHAAGFYYDNEYIKRSRELVIISGTDSTAQEYAESTGLEFSVFENEKVYPSDIALLYQRITETGNENSFRIIPVFKPENITEKKVIWTSSDESVATVDNGIVKPVVRNGMYNTGKTIITAQTENGLSVSLQFGAVCSEGINYFYVVGEPVVMIIDTERYLSAPQMYADKIIWESDNENVAVVSDDGKISAVGEGHATITARNEDGIIAAFDITVEGRGDTEVSYEKSDVVDIGPERSDVDKKTSQPEKKAAVTSVNEKERSNNQNEAPISYNPDRAPSTGSPEELYLLFAIMAVSLFTGCICIIYSKQKRSVSK